MTYQQLWCCVGWPEQGWSEKDAAAKFDTYWSEVARPGHEREVRDHWQKALEVVRAVIEETEK